MSAVVYRAPMLNPRGADTLDAWADGGLRVRDGRIEAIGDFDAVMRVGEAHDHVEVLEGVIVPGFADVHIHWVQHPVRGAFEASLMPWLREHIWPEEMRYADEVFAAAAARRFYTDTVRAGTVMGMSYSSAHADAVRIADDARVGDWMTGDVVMEHGAPEALTRASVHEAIELDRRASGLGAERYVVTPRFALNCTPRLMADLGAYARVGGFHVQTHLSESAAEIREVLREFPEADDYTDIYDRAGLLGPRTVLGHCVHLSAREWAVLRARGCWIAHCPSSNEALDSGRMDLEAVRRHGIPYALASDVGAGPSHSLLHVMQRFLEIHRAADVAVSGTEALYRATLAGAECMGRSVVAGNLDASKRADFVLLPSPGGPLDAEGWIGEWTRGAMHELENRPLATWIAGERHDPATVSVNPPPP
ncbi:guanine deaminase [Acidihalobacter yilgarnensis]|uniref:Guanine deaminase n=1 Tax=Acidihalobacter yilgarnensis TaxID=2819280 RepID=A0A1D8IKE6_9GAMM|nr:amidohydrolase family protein [Acidihalobacter yilgarnensis]AOU96943.1 guanine deaminase [Acidihalobacter yilgarnensis]